MTGPELRSAMPPDDFRAHLSRLGYSQAGFARRMQTNEKTVRRWGAGETPIPLAVQMLLRDERLKPAK